MDYIRGIYGICPRTCQSVSFDKYSSSLCSAFLFSCYFHLCNVTHFSSFPLLFLSLLSLVPPFSFSSFSFFSRFLPFFGLFAQPLDLILKCLESPPQEVLYVYYLK